MVITGMARTAENRPEPALWSWWALLTFKAIWVSVLPWNRGKSFFPEILRPAFFLSYMVLISPFVFAIALLFAGGAILIILHSVYLGVLRAGIEIYYAVIRGPTCFLLYNQHPASVHFIEKVLVPTFGRKIIAVRNWSWRTRRRFPWPVREALIQRIGPTAPLPFAVILGEKVELISLQEAFREHKRGNSVQLAEQVVQIGKSLSIQWDASALYSKT